MFARTETLRSFVEYHMEMEKIQRVPLSLLVCLGLVYLANAQTGLLCPTIALDDLGSTSNFSDQGLIHLALVTSGDSQEPVPVFIHNYRVLCDVSGINRNTSSSISVLVEFQCDFPSGSGTLAACDGNTMLTRQYQLSCGDQNQWSTIVAGSATFVQTVDPTATFSTTPKNQCRLCIDERQLPESTLVHDPDTHCQCKYIEQL